MTASAQPAMAPWSPAPAQLAMAYSVCRGITRANARNFYYAFLVLPKRKRQALSAVYAFMRRCDDIADDPQLGVQERRHRLDTWLDALHRVQQGHPSDDPILLALTDAQRRYTIPAGLLDDLATGTSMDVVDPAPQDFGFGGNEEASLNNSSPHLTVQYQTFEELKLYCYKVASVVGLVIRDVKEDAAMGRVYLPQEDLTQFGLSTADVLDNPDAARFRALLAFEASRAQEGYRAGDQLISYISEDSRPALYVLVNIYRKLLEKIAARQYDVFSGKVSLTIREKLQILGKGFWQRIA